jgi:hypothetical protein
MFEYVSFPIFLISLAIGLFYVYVVVPAPHVIVVYPTPDNSKEFQFKDSANNCFEYEAKEIKCPSDKTLIKDIPIQRNHPIDAPALP